MGCAASKAESGAEPVPAATMGTPPVPVPQTKPAPAALDAQMTAAVKTIAEQSGTDAETIAAMLKLDVDAVRAVLAA